MASKFNAGGVYITADVDDSAFNRKIKEMAENTEHMADKISNSAFGKLNSAFKKLGSAVSGLTAGFVALFAVKKVVDFTKEWRKLYKVQEQAEKKLHQMMKNTGVYTLENLNEMKKYAAELQNVSNYGDEFLMPIIADLSKAKMSTEQLKEATKAAVNMMAGGQSADMLSRVLEKPLEMAGSLHRMGILINKEELQGLSLEEQRSKILDEINKKYGGMAEAMQDSYAQYQNALGDLKEVLGGGVAAVLDPVYKYLTKIIISLQKILKPIMNVLGQVSNLITKIPGIRNTFKGIRIWLDSFGHFFNQIETILVPALKLVEKVFDKINKISDMTFFKPLEQLMGKFIGFFDDAAKDIGDRLNAFVYSDIIKGIKTGQMTAKSAEEYRKIEYNTEERQKLIEAIEQEMYLVNASLPYEEQFNKVVKALEGAADNLEESADAFGNGAIDLGDALNGLGMVFDEDSDVRNAYSLSQEEIQALKDNYTKLREAAESLKRLSEQAEQIADKVSLADFIKQVESLVDSTQNQFDVQKAELRKQAKAEYDKQIQEGKVKNDDELNRAYKVIDDTVDKLQQQAYKKFKEAFDDKTINAIKEPLNEMGKISKSINELYKELDVAVNDGTVLEKDRVENEKKILELLKHELDNVANDLVNGINSANNAIRNSVDSDELSKSTENYKKQMDLLSSNIATLDKKINRIKDDASDFDKQRKEEYEKTKKLLEAKQAEMESIEKYTAVIGSANVAIQELSEKLTENIGKIRGVSSGNYGGLANLVSNISAARSNLKDLQAKNKQKIAATQSEYQTKYINAKNNNASVSELKALSNEAIATTASLRFNAKAQEDAAKKALSASESLAALSTATALLTDVFSHAATGIQNNIQEQIDDIEKRKSRLDSNSQEYADLTAEQNKLSKKLEKVGEGAEIATESLTNFAQGFEESGSVWGGLISMFMGWLMRIMETLGALLPSLETAFVTVSNLFDALGVILAPVVTIIEWISAPLISLTSIIVALFKALKPVVKIFEVILSPVKKLMELTNKLTDWIAPDDNHEVTIVGFDELVDSAKEIEDNIKKLSESINKVASIMSNVQKATKTIQDTVGKLINTTYNKNILKEIYESTLSTIESQGLYKDESVNLELYKSLFDSNGNVQQDVANRILLSLEHSELDANDFYAGMGSKLKDLVSQLSSLQTEQDNGYETITDSVKSLIEAQEDLKEQSDSLKTMLANSGLDSASADAIYKTIKKINDVNKSIDDFTTDFAGKKGSDSGSIVAGIKNKIESVASASDENASALNKQYFGANSSLGKMESTTAGSLNLIEGYVKSIRDYLLKSEQATLAASRKDELYNLFKNSVDNIDWSGYFQYDGFDQDLFMSNIKKAIGSISLDDLTNDELYNQIRSYASNFDIEGSRHSWYNNGGKSGSAKQNANSYYNEAAGDIANILKNAATTITFADGTKLNVGETPIYDFNGDLMSSSGTESKTMTATEADIAALLKKYFGYSDVTIQSNGVIRASYSKSAKDALPDYWNALGSALLSGLRSNKFSANELAMIKNILNNGKIVRDTVAALCNQIPYLKTLINNQRPEFNYSYEAFSKGGWTGNIPIDKISGFVHGQEYVVKAPYAADYRPALEAINAGRGNSIFGNQSALQNVNINIDSTIRANDPLSMINEWNKELRNRNLRLELKKV